MSSEHLTEEVVHDVRLVSYPLRLGARASEHYEGVFRELALLAASRDIAPSSGPARLVGLVEAIGRRHALDDEHEQQRDEALARGETSIELNLSVPASVASVAPRLDALLDETDDLCRDGTLLTLQAAEDVLAFRRWYLGELAGQLGGRPAVPWPGGAARSPPDPTSARPAETPVSAVPAFPGVLPATAVRVLLVEDDEGDAFLVGELLLEAASDVSLTRAHSLAEAALLLPGDIDCILLDLGLPDVQGLQSLGKILELAPAIAVLVLTGLSDEKGGIEAVAAGAQDYLVKGSIDGALLTRAIRYAVERKRADESVRRLYASELRATENARLERGLLPQPLVANAGVKVVARYRPGRHQSLLGGDFYDVVERPDGAVFALIGDVAGHGPDEAAIGVCLRIAWRTLVLAGHDPETILSSMHAVLVSERESDEVFATVAMVRVLPAQSVARFWLAGHPVPVLVEQDRVVPGPQEAIGVALGVMDGATWTGVDRAVGRDTALTLFTDGLIEGLDGPGSRRRLGDVGLYALMEGLLRQGLVGAELADALLAEVRALNGEDLGDDVAVLVLSWAGWE